MGRFSFHMITSAGSGCVTMFISIRQSLQLSEKTGEFFLFYISQNSLGGRVRFVISGSAPLRDDVMIFLRCALGCQVDTKNCRVKGKNYLATTWRRTSCIIVDGSQISLQRHFTRSL